MTIAAAAAGLAIGPASAAAQLSCPTSISNDTILTDDVVCPDGFTGTAIVVLAPDVTLDGAGFTIDAKDGTGIVSLRTGTAIRDVTIEATGQYGALIEGDDASIRGVTVRGAQTGTLISNADGVTYQDNAMLGCGQGANFQNVTNLAFDASDFSGSAAGVRLGAVTGPVTITNSSTFDNMGDGIAISFADGSSDLHVAGVTVVGQAITAASVGVRISGCDTCTVDEARIESRAVGVRAIGGSMAPHVLHSTVIGADVAYEFTATVNSVCHDNTADGVGRGLSIESASGTFVADRNELTGVTDVGIRVASTDGVSLPDNRAIGSGGAVGLLVLNADNLVASAFEVSGFQVGAELDTDTDNADIELSVCGAGLGNGVTIRGGTGNQVAGTLGNVSTGVVVFADAVDTVVDAAFADNTQNVLDLGINTTVTEGMAADADLDGKPDFCGDLCAGDDSFGDHDSDGICGDTDECTGTDATGDLDNDGVCNDIDLCVGDDSTGDTDDDLFCDVRDNCPFDANTDQADKDDDGIGDACDPFDDDFDEDGVPNELDNCPFQPNPEQRDLDNDGNGDVCDFVDDGNGDADADGVLDDDDNCPLQANPDQADRDADGFGDVCDGNSFHDDGCQSAGGGGWPWAVLIVGLLIARRREGGALR